MKVTISVTEQDIREGKPEDCYACPIALAVRRALPAVTRIAVDFDRIDLGWMGADGAATHYAMLPRAAMAFIDDFDDEDAVQPLTLDIEVPDELAGAQS